MTTATDWMYDGAHGALAAHTWRGEQTPRYVAVLCHGYGEYVGRYEHVADALVQDGAVVYGVDHQGHGHSDGERVLVADIESVVDDVDGLVSRARSEWPGLPVALIGHSMGGLVAARYAQRFGAKLAVLVLSGPVIGRMDLVPALLSMDEIPDIPIDPATLSRDDRVGAAYAADPLVWHGPFKRPTLLALQAGIDAVNAAGSLGALPLLWIHGELDQLVPIDGSREGVERIRGLTFEQRIYEGARHEVFNETNQDEVIGDVIAFVNRALDRASS
ncbi:MAG TPA: alpha/beta hydrolase [Candidatus Lustribacter sp.]|nr:alpha/beta hydrolase [Candidatus Lustribacter sp.]